VSHNALAEVQAQMRACLLCDAAGFDIVAGAVFSGDAAARVMLIGQAPGITEQQVKRPFNGTSGTRLFQWLAQAGWEEDDFRQRHYMTAVTKCYPGRHKSGKGDRVPTMREQQLCRPYLTREVALVNPRVLILVGGLSIKQFYPAKTKLREIIGTAQFFNATIADNRLSFRLAGSEKVRAVQDEIGWYVVPLPHPSGASLWTNSAENKILINHALTLLSDLRTRFSL
jgi:uracil-DNA glycosylase